MRQLIWLLGLLVAFPLPAQSKSARSKPRPSVIATVTPTQRTPTPTPEVIEKAKFEKLYRAGKVLRAAAGLVRLPSTAVLAESKKEFGEAAKAYDLECSIATDSASSALEKSLVNIYCGSEVSTLISLISFDFFMAALRGEVDAKHRSDMEGKYRKLADSLSAAEALYLERDPKPTPTPGVSAALRSR